MSEFSKNFDWFNTAADILKVFNEYPTEFQLVWLYELIVLRLFKELKDTDYTKYMEFDGMTYKLKPKRLSMLLGSIGLSADCYGKLLNYRNLFVHAGIRGKAVLLHILREYKNDLIELANFVGVELDLSDIKLVRVKG